jgi:LuxR family maltose regulon positive regulatory protein
MSAFPLLSTKLNLPPRRSSLVARPRLLRLLELSLMPGNRLTLLAAPAGFGKTCLVIDWQNALAQRGIPMAWLSLDEADNDLSRFLRYLMAALRKIRPELGETVLALLDLPQRPPVENLMVALINEIEINPSDFVLVLDDYQVIGDLAVVQAVGYLVDHQPAQCHLALTTRSDPMLPLARLRARGEVNEIRAADLRFSAEEARQFIQNFTRLNLSVDQAALLEQRTEGWIAGLQMAAIALQAYAARRGDQPEVEDFLKSFSGTHQYVFDYLAQEVLNQQGTQVIDFLYQTALFDRICPALCDTLTGRDDSRQILRMLDQSNLFIQALDEHRQWYRYHRLFADFLRAGLDAQSKPMLLRRASLWFESNGLVEEAVTYAVKAEDWLSAARLMRQAAPRLCQTGDIGTLMAWFSALPEAVVRADPDLAIYLGWVSLWANGMSIAASFAHQAASSMAADATDDCRGRLYGLQAYLAYAASGDYEKAVQSGEEAVRLIDPSNIFFRTTVLSLLGQIQRQSGSVVTAMRTFEEAVREVEFGIEAQSGQINTGLAILQGNLALCYQLHGERRRAAATCRAAIHPYIDSRGQVSPTALFIYMPWVGICFDGNELAEARQYVEIGMELCRKMGTSPTVVGGANLLAAIRFLEGDSAGALADVRANRAEALRMQLPWIADAAGVVEAWFELKLGNLAFVEAWAQKAALPPLTTADPKRINEQFLQARLLLAQHHFEEACILLHALRMRAEQDERFQALLEIDVLMGMACQGLGHMDEALAWIERAARLAAPEGSLRAFLNDDASSLVATLRASLKGRAEEGLTQFLDQLLLCYQAESGDPVPIPPAALRPQKPAGLIEPVTPRELEVLNLMAESFSNAEIARRLYLTINTLKAHTNSIYGKLDVHSRMQAVNRARELGLLAAPKN